MEKGFFYVGRMMSNLEGGYMDVPVRTESLKIKMTFQAGLRFNSGAIQLYTLRYMQKKRRPASNRTNFQAGLGFQLGL